jgi:hypothetical protein
LLLGLQSKESIIHSQNKIFITIGIRDKFFCGLKAAMEPCDFADPLGKVVHHGRDEISFLIRETALANRYHEAPDW